MREGLLDLLQCPACQSGLTLRSARRLGDHVQSGTLSCRSGHDYAIREFLPVFAPPIGYMEAFSTLRQTSAAHLPTTGDLDVAALTLEEFIGQTQIDPEELRGKLVLDAGCGGGRFTKLLAGHGARVVGLDLDGVGLRAARDELSGYEDVDFVQADLFNLPFRPGAFDCVYSLGVLHHTPDPRRAFLGLTSLLRAGGQIAVWVYPRSERTPVSDWLRTVTTRMPPRSLYWLAWAVTASYGPLLRIPRLNRKLRGALYGARLPWHESGRWRVHSFLDWYGPTYQHKRSSEELEDWCVAAGLVDIARCPYASSIRGRAPA